MPQRRCRVATANTSAARTLRQTTSLRAPTSTMVHVLIVDVPTTPHTTMIRTHLKTMAVACMQAVSTPRHAITMRMPTRMTALVLIPIPVTTAWDTVSWITTEMAFAMSLRFRDVRPQRPATTMASPQKTTEHVNGHPVLDVPMLRPATIAMRRSSTTEVVPLVGVPILPL